MTKVTRAAKGGWVALFVLLASIAIIAALLLAGQQTGEARIINGLRTDGYDVLIDRSVEPGEGRYCVRIWERGVGWVEVER